MRGKVTEYFVTVDHWLNGPSPRPSPLKYRGEGEIHGGHAPRGPGKVGKAGMLCD
jgi:hypothetical protein